MQKLKLRSQWKDFGVFVCFMLDKLEMKEQVISEESIQRKYIYKQKGEKYRTEVKIYRIHIKDVTCIYKWSSSHI